MDVGDKGEVEAARCGSPEEDSGGCGRGEKGRSFLKEVAFEHTFKS